MKESILLEGMNSNFLILSVCAVLGFSFYIVKNWNEGYIFLRPAISLWGVFIGEIVLRGNFWWSRHVINGGDTTYQPAIWSTVIGSFISSWAILCMIAVFAPEKYRTRAWATSLFVSIAFTFMALARVF